MSLLVTGSIGIDTVETPHERREDLLGGSTTYFALAASLFTPVRVVGVVGEDFDRALLDPLAQRGCDLSGVESRAGSRTFRWHGRYLRGMNERTTVAVALNVLAERAADIPPHFLDSTYVFLANSHPAQQFAIAERLPAARLVVCDTMNLWIENEPAALRKLLARVQGVVLNDEEARLLTGEGNLVTAGRAVMRMGPQFVVIKKGEHGSLLVCPDDLFVVPSYPTECVVDPTGCGDAYAGALMGYLAAQERVDAATLRGAVARGSVIGSFVIESFSIDALLRATREEVERRLSELRSMVQFD